MNTLLGASQPTTLPAKRNPLIVAGSEQPALTTGAGASDCLDLDDECVDVKNHLACYLYDTTRGRCPFLRNRQN